jgi:deoxyribose-phosphate aldolase
MINNHDLAGMIDYTLLKPEATEAQVRELCREAKQHGFYAVCISPWHVETAASCLQGSSVRVCTVIGFPLGNTTTAVKAFEAAEAVGKGAQELDMVINIGALREGSWEAVKQDIEAVVCAARGLPVKVIIETGLLTDQEIAAACRLAKTAGASFIKTSTGFMAEGATRKVIQLIRDTIGATLGIKAAGGIRTRKQALELIEAGAIRIGTSAGPAIIGPSKP